MKAGVVHARGIDFHTLEAGDGPLVLCLHGFPDLARSFCHQLPALAAAGFRAVAPFMRGYAPTTVPPDGCYQSAALAEDAVALIEALGYEDAVVFGHDWGAVAGYGAAIVAPERVRKLVTAAVPHAAQVMTAFTTNYAQLKRSWYMFFFQSPLAEVAIAHDDYAFIDRLWRDWSPGWSYPPDEMAALKDTFRRPGVLEAALGYYRAMFNPALQDPTLAISQGRMMELVPVPTMCIHGADDGCIGAELFEGMADLFPRGLRVEVIPGAGHFVHRERPETVNRLVLDFLRS